jgi:hypothetical protein
LTAGRQIVQNSNVPQHLFIVSRQQPGLFSYLSREFSGEPEVTVILDRRQGERRGSDPQTSEARTSEEATAGQEQANEPQDQAAANRRQADRRLQAEIMAQLSTLGYAFVRLA